MHQASAFDLAHTPALGGTAPTTADRTAHKLGSFAVSYAARLPSGTPKRYLDIGCGNGFITSKVGGSFSDVVGVDVEPGRLAEFRSRVDGDGRYTILEQSASATGLQGASFALITCFEVLEHVPDVSAVADEIVRLCAPGGIVIVSTPQVWFPFENHGITLGGRVIDRKIPLLPYLPALHRRLSRARVFSSAALDRIFAGRGLTLLHTAYAAPQFERAAARAGTWESYMRFLRPVLDQCEHIPGLKQLTGVSILKAYSKPVTDVPRQGGWTHCVQS